MRLICVGVLAVMLATAIAGCTPRGQAKKLPEFEVVAPENPGTIDQLVGTVWTQPDVPIPPKVHFENRNTVDVSGKKYSYVLADGILTIDLGDGKEFKGTWDGNLLVINRRRYKRVSQ